jgi:hypothetical protein
MRTTISKRIVGDNMKKSIILTIFASILVLILANFASAVIFNVTAARQKEWERYEQYKADYIKFNNLEGYKNYVYEPNLINNFGFRPASYYYISPQVLQAKYNPPLQGEVYYTDTRGRDTSLNHPSAIQYYGDIVNGRYTGYIPSDVNGKYFDHPDMHNTYGNVYTSTYGSAYDNAYNNVYGSTYINQYGSAANGYPCTYGTTNTNAYYARISENLADGFYVVGFY